MNKPMVEIRRRFKIRNVFFVSAFFLVALVGTLRAQQLPNILFILSDDHAVNAVGCYDKRLSHVAETPNIDRLAREGMRFTNCFATNSICTPSRASIMTGKYSHKNGVYGLYQQLSSQPTSATIAHQHGYQTAVYGKWHLGTLPEGFDDYKVLHEQGKYWDPEFHQSGSETLVPYRGWVDDLSARMAMDFIRSRDTTRPFMVMCHFKGIHDPWLSPPPFDTLYSDQTIPEPSNLCDRYEHRSAAARNTTLKLERLDQRTFHHTRLEGTDTCAQRKHIYQQFIKAYLRGVKAMDDRIGKLVAFLEQEGLLDNTIIIYTTDQGHFLGEHGYFSKRFIYEESIQMPLIVRYPSRVKAGSIEEALVANVDIAPTLLDLAGIPTPSDMQGQSIKGFLFGKPPAHWRTGIYYRYWQHMTDRKVPAHYGLRTKDFKLVYYYGKPLGQSNLPETAPEWELFDLRRDPGEMNNVFHEPAYAREVKKLMKQMEALKLSLGDEQ